MSQFRVFVGVLRGGRVDRALFEVCGQKELLLWGVTGPSALTSNPLR